MSHDSSAIAPKPLKPGDASHAALIAKRMRNNTISPAAYREARLPSFAIEHAVSGDLGHLHATHDLRLLRVESDRKLIGPFVVRLKNSLRRALHPLPESQSVWNGANVRVVTFLVRQVAMQGHAIESLEQQISELHEELNQTRAPHA